MTRPAGRAEKRRVAKTNLPGSLDIRFRKDGPQGTVRLTTTAADGTPITVFAQNQRGPIVNLRTDKAIGRDLGGQLYFDLDGVRGAIETEAELAGKSESERRPKAATDEPKLSVPRRRRTSAMVQVTAR